MKDLLIKIKLFLEGQQAAHQAAASVREVDTATKGAAAGQGALQSAVSGCMGRLAGFAAICTGGVLVAVSAVTAVVQKMGDAFRASQEAAAESEASALKLNNALANTGQFSREASQQIQDLATEQQNLTNVSDETWQESAAKLIQYGAAIEDIPQYIQIIEDLAGRMDGDVPRATQAFIGAMIGTRTELQRMGFHVEDGASKLDRLNEIMRIAGSGAGLLRQQTEILGGGWKAVAVQIGDVWENLGKLLNVGGILTGTLRAIAAGLKGVNDLLGVTTDNTAKLVSNKEGMRQFAGTMGEVGGAAADAADGISEAGDAAEGAGAQMAGAATKAQSYADALKAANEESMKAATAAGTDADRTQRNEEARINANPMLDDAQKARQIGESRAKALAEKEEALKRARREILGRNEAANTEAGYAELQRGRAESDVSQKRDEFSSAAAAAGLPASFGMAGIAKGISDATEKLKVLQSSRAALAKSVSGPGGTAAADTSAIDAEIDAEEKRLATFQSLAGPRQALADSEAALREASARAEAAQTRKQQAAAQTPADLKANSDALTDVTTEKINNAAQTKKAAADAEKKAADELAKKQKDADEKRKQARIQALEDELDGVDAEGKLRLANLDKSGLKDRALRDARRQAEDEIAAQRLDIEDQIGKLKGESDAAFRARGIAYEAAKAARDAEAAKATGRGTDSTWDRGVRDGHIDGRSQRQFGPGGELLVDRGTLQPGATRSALGTVTGSSMLDSFAAETARRRQEEAARAPAGKPTAAAPAADAAKPVNDAAGAATKASENLNAAAQKLNGSIGQINTAAATLSKASSGLGSAVSSLKTTVDDLKARVDAMQEGT